MNDENRKIDIDAIPGERWFPKETSFAEDMQEYWGDWGVSSEVETLRAVLLRRPGKEVEDFDANANRFTRSRVDVELMRKQHDAVADLYRQNGVKSFLCGRAERRSSQCCILQGLNVYDPGRRHYNEAGYGCQKRRRALYRQGAGGFGGTHCSHHKQ